MFFFFFNDTATTEIYTLSLHDALPISLDRIGRIPAGALRAGGRVRRRDAAVGGCAQPAPRGARRGGPRSAGRRRRVGAGGEPGRSLAPVGGDCSRGGAGGGRGRRLDRSGDDEEGQAGASAR